MAQQWEQVTHHVTSSTIHQQRLKAEASDLGLLYINTATTPYAVTYSTEESDATDLKILDVNTSQAFWRSKQLPTDIKLQTALDDIGSLYRFINATPGAATCPV